MEIVENGKIRIRKRGKSCSILLPESCIGFFKIKKIQHRSLKHLTSFLVKSHLWKFQIIENPPNARISCRYQEKSQNLRKFNFIPDENDWIRLKIIAQARGVSIALLFVWLLRLEREGSAGVHAYPKSITLKTQIQIPEKNLRRIIVMRT